jgi:hypothetical protein
VLCLLYQTRPRQTRCHSDCPGWGWFNGSEVQRCDQCGVFDTDEDATDHIRGCNPCRDRLAKDVLTEVLSDVG